MDEKRTAWKSQAILFLISQCITLFGSALIQMAIIWYVTIQTSSGVWVAAFTICSYLPQFLISFAAGVWADRHSRKKLIIVSDSLIAFSMTHQQHTCRFTSVLFHILHFLTQKVVFFKGHWFLTYNEHIPTNKNRKEYC